MARSAASRVSATSSVSVLSSRSFLACAVSSSSLKALNVSACLSTSESRAWNGARSIDPGFCANLRIRCLKRAMRVVTTRQRTASTGGSAEVLTVKARFVS